MATIITAVFGYLRVPVVYRSQLSRISSRGHASILNLRPPPVAFSFSLFAHPAFPALRASPLNLDQATNEGPRSITAKNPGASPFSRSFSRLSLSLFPIPFVFYSTLVYMHIHIYTRACATRTHIQRPFYSPRFVPPPQHPPLSS